VQATATHLRWLFSPHGRVTRGAFLAWGGGLTAAKMLLDWMLCNFVLGVQWTPGIYLYVPVAMQRGVEGAWGWLVLAAVSVPFAWVGMVLTVRRLRDAGLNPWLVSAFVLPVANLVLFALLSLLPSDRRAAGPVGRSASPARSPLEFGPVPALLACLATVGLVGLGTGVLRTYGTGLFLGAPFLQGMLVGVLSRQRDCGYAFGQFFLSGLLTMVLLMVFAWEGLMCILMATPLWIPMGIAGLCLARVLVATPRHAASALLVVPLAQWAEPHLLPPATIHEVTSELVVQAPPAVVWRHLLAFPELPPPTELPFRVGIAYPVHANIEGEGPGAIRRCSFSTGDFVEPIEVWDEPHLLAFSVQQSPQPMVEWNPFHDHVDAPHLHGMFLARRGQFALRQRADGTTLLSGTTWYSHGLWPEAYWSWWSDWLVHTIHRRVLAHIARCAEDDVR